MALDKLVDSEQLNAALTNIANKIRSKTGKSSELSFPNDFESEIESIQTGGGGDTPVASPALTLIDWEGTILKEYSSEDTLALAALPAPNTLSTYSIVDHDLLSFQEWNGSLADIKTWINNHSGENLLVGAIYATTDNQDHNYWRSSRLENTATAIYMQKRATNSTFSIQGYDFSGCVSLKSINIPDGVIGIGTYAFQNCYSLASINIPDSVISIGDNAFQNCASLTSISIPNGATIIGSYAFRNCYSLTSINIPDGVTSIGIYTFSSCVSLKSINIPDGVTSIGNYAFQNCTSLTSVNIPDSVTSIGNYAFQNCTSLTSVNIPDSVTSIGSYAFRDDKLLIDVIIHGKPNLLNTNAFNNNHENCLFYVPRENLSWFETATNWSTLYSSIVAIEDNIAYLESIGISVDEYK